MSPQNPASSDLFKQTLRTVIVLVAACVVFVGTLSAAAVGLTSRAFAAPASAAELTPAKSDAKSAKSDSPEAVPAKKPQSI